MTITFTNFEDKKTAFAASLQEGDEKKQSEALNEMLEALAADVEKDILGQVNTQMADNAVMQGRGENVLTSEEMQFFNAVVEEGGFKETETLPKTTQERVFKDLVESHPLLQAIGIQNLGAVTEFIYGTPEGSAVWGPLFGDIQGQLNANFRKESISQLKLTAFIPLSNDMLKLGPAWIERYVRTMIREAMSAGLEYGYVAGRGSAQNEPVGLLKTIDPDTGAVSDKTSAGTLTFEPGRVVIQEMKGVVENLSTHMVSGEERVRNVAGKVVMVVNPFDNIGIQANATIQNANGAYVTNLPFNPTIAESKFVPKGKTVFFVRGEYIAAVGGADPIKKFDQTMALEDATLYIAKQYATGKPVDNYATQVYDLQLDDTTTTTTSTTTTA